ncbi:MAG TPA: acylphosphatase [Rhodocyclaceae bacterium]|nr:acylphosphatase [Rhodocyclaceae bacterium]
MSDRVSRHLSITGLVQGVSFRWYMVQEARRLGVDGWVRNRRDGSVEAAVAGPEDQVRQLVEWARRGPPAAQVDGVDLGPWDAPLDPGFEQAPTV